MPLVTKHGLRIVWSPHDICSASGLDLTDGQVQEVMHRLAHNYDAEYGVTNNIVFHTARNMFPNALPLEEE